MWATSIGSTFAHSPVCGVRKSGIPDGTEIPAPVSATTERAEEIRPASRTALTWSSAGEPRRPLAEEGGDALARVLGREGLEEARLLGLDALVEVAGVGDALDLLE